VAYRLEAGEAPAGGVHRSLLGEVDRAAGHVRARAPDRLDEDIHEARKALKRARTALRLLRPLVGAGAYRAAARPLRDAGRALAGTRDAAVTPVTLDDLLAGADLPPGAFAGLSRRLAREHAQAADAALVAGAGPCAEALARLGAGREAVAGWSFGPGAEQAVLVGLERVYRDGRRRLRRARAERTPEALHALRRRVKDLGYAAELLGPAWPAMLGALAAEARRLWGDLGAHHDLAMLGQAAQARANSLRPGEGEHLVALLAARGAVLERRALPLAALVYVEGTAAFRARVGGYLGAWLEDPGVGSGPA
jgi:CHAD domain-containing protein